MSDALNKSIDSLIDDLFVDDEDINKSEELENTEEVQVEGAEDVEKSMIKDHKPQKETADEAKAQVPGYQDDAARGAGRPKQISDVPKTDTDGKRAKDYDGAIAEKNEDGKKKEDSQVKPPKDMKKSVEISEEEYAAFQAFQKSQAEAKEAEELKKAEEKQSDLIKSAVAEAIKPIQEERDELKAALAEQGELVKSIANKPQRKKSVTNVAALEKSGNASQGNQGQASAAELKQIAMDVADELVKSKQLTVEQAIELENTGFIYDQSARRTLEVGVQKEMKKRFG